MKIETNKIEKTVEKDGKRYVFANGKWFREWKPGNFCETEINPEAKAAEMTKSELLRRISEISIITLRPGFEMDIVAQFQQKYERFGNETFVSEKQFDVLKKIVNTRTSADKMIDNKSI